MSELNNKPAENRKAKAPKPQKAARSAGDAPNPVWFKPVMFGFMLLGLAWIITYYVTEAQYPLGAATAPLNLSNWNILIGFGIAMVGFMMTTRWK
jgi:hypothetical protein